MIKTKVFLDGRRNFDGGFWIGGRSMCHRQHRDQRFAIGLALDGERNDAGPVFASFFLSALCFAIPHIGVGDGQARFWCWNCHATRYF